MNRSIIAKAAALAAALLPILALAQGGNPAGVAPLTPERAPGVPALHHPNDADRLFVRQAAIGGKAEVESGRMAARSASSADVKAFAQRMVDDHTKANQRLAGLADAAHVPVPGELDPDHKNAAAALGRLDGDDFDREYVAQQIADHQQTLQLLEWQIGAGQDDALKDYAKETIPTVLGHLEEAQSIDRELKSAALAKRSRPRGT